LLPFVVVSSSFLRLSPVLNGRRRRNRCYLRSSAIIVLSSLCWFYFCCSSSVVLVSSFFYRPLIGRSHIGWLYNLARIDRDRAGKSKLVTDAGIVVVVSRSIVNLVLSTYEYLSKTVNFAPCRPSRAAIVTPDNIDDDRSMALCDSARNPLSRETH